MGDLFVDEHGGLHSWNETMPLPERPTLFADQMIIHLGNMVWAEGMEEKVVVLAFAEPGQPIEDVQCFALPARFVRSTIEGLEEALRRVEAHG